MRERRRIVKLVECAPFLSILVNHEGTRRSQIENTLLAQNANGFGFRVAVVKTMFGSVRLQPSYR